MDISGIIQSYDSRAPSSAAQCRAIMAPHHYVPVQTFSGAPSTALVAPHSNHPPVHHNPFAFASYNGHHSPQLVPPFPNNFIPHRQPALPRMMQPDSNAIRGIPFSRPTRQGFVIEEHHSQSPPIKPEPLWTPPTNSHSPGYIPPSPHTNPNGNVNGNTSTSSNTSANTNANSVPSVNTNADPKTPLTTSPASTTGEVSFGTEVDTLMKAIQAKSSTQPQPPSPIDQSRPVVGPSQTPNHGCASQQGISSKGGETNNPKLTQVGLQEDVTNSKGSKKRYQCTIEGCTKSFYQKTHLDIHERAHTGVKPYPCKEPGCGRTFSQLGNLKTHERRHTGERPYQCEICGKRFAQRGNVRAHKIVHDQSKPYLCRLDDCGKQFTQLGNLKSHQNKFHIATIRALTDKFAKIKDGDIVHAGDKELWEYFANLYKNSNKGIKGRGKDRKVGSSMMMSSMRNMGVNSRGSFGLTGPGRSNIVTGGGGSGGSGGGTGLHMTRGDGSHYEMYALEDSHSGQNGSRGSSSVGTCYDDAPSDGFDEAGRPGDLAFGDRIY